MLIVAPVRAKWRAIATRLSASAQAARVAAGDRGCTDRAIARHWKIRGHSRIAALFRPESGKAIHFGDVLALPTELARDILVRALAALDEGGGPGPRETVDHLAIALGHATSTLMADLADDGRLAAHDRHAASFARIATIALRGQGAAERAAQRDAQ